MNKLFRELSKLIPDKTYLTIKYRIKFRRKLNLKVPKTFTEKIQWLKLYDRKKEYSKLVDKCEVKKHVAEKIGEEHVIKTIGVWERFEDIDFKKLPEQFVLKCTHDCGSVIICDDKSKFNIEVAKKKIKKSLKTNYYWGEREWPYKQVKPRIIAEEYIKDFSGKGLKDYKFFCFNGSVKALFVATDRNVEGKEVKFDFFDENFIHLNIRNGHDNATVEISRPENFEKMKELAERLSQGFSHARIDFYDVNGKILFGEITLYHFGGFVKFEPEEWDYKFGELIKLPNKKKRTGQ